MHCDRCNIDFPEGLHYCKWCGGALVDRPRVTSELHTCPSCAVAIQPAWTFCKSCGERLHTAAVPEAAGAACPECGENVEPGARHCSRCGQNLTSEAANQVAQGSAETMVMVTCPSCGEYLDAGTVYCKECGSAVYTEPTPFGDSALLCGACNSYSPVGSRDCRVCGASFAQGSQTVVDRPAFRRNESDTLIPEDPSGALAAGRQQQPQFSSGENTLIFGGADSQPPPKTSSSKTSVRTSMLPGTAGSRSEQQTKTSVVQMGRITSPVEESEMMREKGASSGELENTAATDQDRLAALDPATQVPVNQAALPESTTSGFGSEPVISQAPSVAGTEVFASPVSKSPAAKPEQPSQDDVRTREIVRPPLPDLAGPTRIQQAWPGAIQNSAQPIEPGVTREMSSAGVTTVPVEPASPELPRKPTGVLYASIAVGVIVIVAAVVVGYWLLFARGRTVRPQATSVVAEQPSVTPDPAAPPPKPAAPVPEGMLTVGAGSYAIGRDGADPLEHPRHKIDLAVFFIDRTEVTNAAYKKFVDATGHKPPSNWTGASFPNRRDNSPVTGVTWQDAADYAAWSGKRLPSEDEWEASARGADGRIYPWGNLWRSGLANIGAKTDDITAEKYPSGLKEVGQFPQGASPAGAVDMIGNAWEWVADEIAPYPGNTETKLTLKPGVTYRVIRGGAYDGNKAHDATYRGFLDASLAYPKVGFRCAKAAK
jgi:gamma-glutamyl hercynylcysteine S-oxide synthase